MSWRRRRRRAHDPGVAAAASSWFDRTGPESKKRSARSAAASLGQRRHFTRPSRSVEHIMRYVDQVGSGASRGLANPADLGPTAACHEQQLSGTAHRCLERCPSAGRHSFVSLFERDAEATALHRQRRADVMLDGVVESLVRSAAQLRALTFSGTRDLLQQFQQHVSLALAQVREDLAVRL